MTAGAGVGARQLKNVMGATENIRFFCNFRRSARKYSAGCSSDRGVRGSGLAVFGIRAGRVVKPHKQRNIDDLCRRRRLKISGGCFTSSNRTRVFSQPFLFFVAFSQYLRHIRFKRGIDLSQQ